MINIRSFIFLITIYFFNLSNLYAIDPEIFVQSTVNRASKILSKEINSQTDRLKFICRIEMNGSLFIIWYSLNRF